MNDLVAFLRARLDEDEIKYHRITDNAGDLSESADMNDLYILGEADRMLIEIKVKRAILDLHTELYYGGEDSGPVLCGGYSEAYWDVVRLLATLYVDHPDFDPRWTQEIAT